MIIKHKLLTIILSVVFPIMATRGEEDAEDENEDEEDELTDAEANRPCAVAAQVWSDLLDRIYSIVKSRCTADIRETRSNV